MSEVIERDEVASKSTAITELPPKETALSVFSTKDGLEPYLQRIKTEIDAFVPDTSTAKGRAAIASMAFKVAKVKTAIDGLGKTVSAELKEMPKKVDAERKRTWEKLELWQTEVRKPLTDWEEAEEARVALHKADIQGIADQVDGIAEMDAADILARWKLVDSLKIDDAWEEFEVEAHRVRASTLDILDKAHVTRKKHEAEQAELARLRAEAEARAKRDEEERIAREAAEAATKAAEARAQAERDAAAKREADAKAAAEHRELELKLQAEKAERERLEAIATAEREKAEAIQRAEKAKADAEERQRQAVEAERQRQVDEAARIAAETKAREADKAHKAKINNAAVAAFVAGGLTQECAKLAVTLIAKKKIHAITINY